MQLVEKVLKFFKFFSCSDKKNYKFLNSRSRIRVHEQEFSRHHASHLLVFTITPLLKFTPSRQKKNENSRHHAIKNLQSRHHADRWGASLNTLF